MTPQEYIASNFPRSDEVASVKPYEDSSDMNEDELMELIFHRIAGREGKYPPGSPHAYVRENWPTNEEMDTIMDSLDLSETVPQPTDIFHDPFLKFGRMTNPEAVDAFFASAPESQNVEDRRGQTVDDIIKAYLVQYDQPSPRVDPVSLEDLPMPSFDYAKRGPR